MHTEPDDLDRAALVSALERHWGIDAARIGYLPVGFGSYHWEAVAGDGSRWFVTADDLQTSDAGREADDVFAALDRAFRTAATLHSDAGLEFVLAPVPSRGGPVLRRLDSRYAIHVERYVEGIAGMSGEFERAEQRRRMGTLIGRVHAASDRVSPGLAGRERFALPGHEVLEQALARLDEPWEHGPFGEPTRELLRAHASDVRDRLRAHDRLAAQVRDDPRAWVVTHGEPHSANVIEDRDGDLWLVDWDTTLVGPRERDLWMILDPDLSGWNEYAAVTGCDRPNAHALRLYRERWALGEICVYVAEFRRPHAENADTRTSWQELGEYLR